VSAALQESVPLSGEMERCNFSNEHLQKYRLEVRRLLVVAFNRLGCQLLIHVLTEELRVLRGADIEKSELYRPLPLGRHHCRGERVFAGTVRVDEDQFEQRLRSGSLCQPRGRKRASLIQRYTASGVTLRRDRPAKSALASRDQGSQPNVRPRTRRLSGGSKSSRNEISPRRASASPPRSRRHSRCCWRSSTRRDASLKVHFMHFGGIINVREGPARVLL